MIAGLLVPGAPGPPRAPITLEGELAPLRKPASRARARRPRPRTAATAAPARAARPIPAATTYKWIALSNCTLGVLLATLDASITLIAMPDIFRGIQLDPLVPANTSTCCG